MTTARRAWTRHGHTSLCKPFRGVIVCVTKCSVGETNPFVRTIVSRGADVSVPERSGAILGHVPLHDDAR